MRFQDRKNPWLILIVCVAAIISMLSFALWPVFLIKLRESWYLSNTDIGLISGAYFLGYVTATPILVGFTDKFDAKWIFIAGCFVSLLGNMGFALFAEDFWSALICWSLVGAGLAGTYMPGLQILNGRLSDKERVSAVPWYTSCFGIGTGSSYLLMGYMLINFDHKIAACLGIAASTISILIIYFLVSSNAYLKKESSKSRHPLDFRPVFRKPVALSYIFSYGAHTFELIAYRSWSFALFFFLGSNTTPKLSISSITTIVSAITITGMIASILGAKICQKHLRHKIISLVGLMTTIAAILSAFLLQSTIFISIAMLWIYHFFIMLDSGALTAGAVESSDPDNRGAVLAVHSMIGFMGGAFGGPVIGVVLDKFGGGNSYIAWFSVLIAMGIGSFLVLLIQLRFWYQIHHSR